MTTRLASPSARCLLVGASTLLAPACSKSPGEPSVPQQAAPLEAERADAAARADQPSDDASLSWAPRTFSPRPGSPFEPELEPLLEPCGRGDAALHEVAAWVAEQHHADGGAPSLDYVRFHLHQRGSPYVMPRLWSATMSGVSAEELQGYVANWTAGREALGEFRCGAGVFHGSDGSKTVSVLQTDVLADLQPIPTRVEPGTWLDLEARFVRGATAASVVLLPPDGRPRTVRATTESGTASARFSVATEGTWLVQVMGTFEGGPRPVAAALVTAGKAPPSSIDARPVPGESAFDGSSTPDDALFELMNAARKENGLPLLKRNRRLDRVARQHSDAMLEAGRISHDTGQGDPARRVEMAGLRPKATGENVAMAQSVPRLHRVLWASPSHRGNLLMRRWDEVGVAIAERDDGTLFATQLFADRD